MSDFLSVNRVKSALVQISDFLSDNRVKVALAGALIASTYFLFRSGQKKYKLPPGPRPLPILGNLLSVGKQNFMFQYFVELGKQYGDVFTLYMGPQCCIILNSIDAIREAYLKKGVEFADRPAIYSTELMGKESIAMGQHSAEWKIQRKIAHSALRKYASGEPLELLLQKNAEDVYKLFEEENGEPFDPYPKLTLMVYNIMASMVLGKTFENDDPLFKKIVKDIDELNEMFGNGILADIFPIFKYLPSPTLRKMQTVTDYILEFMHETWDEHMKTFNPDEVTDFVYHVIASKLEAEKEEGDQVALLSDRYYYFLLLDMFFAGTDTSRITLQWVVGVVAQHPEVQARMHKEIDEAVGRDQPISLDHRPHLPYTEAVLHEVMRLYPVAPLAVPRATSCDTELNGYTIPKGTWAMPNIWALHRNPAEWPEPDEFRPERHLDENGSLAPKPNSFLPFSTGRRVCVGEAVAKVELHMLTAMLFQRYEFLPPTGEDLKIEMIPGLGCLPKPFKIIAKARQ